MATSAEVKRTTRTEWTASTTKMARTEQMAGVGETERTASTTGMAGTAQTVGAKVNRAERAASAEKTRSAKGMLAWNLPFMTKRRERELAAEMTEAVLRLIHGHGDAGVVTPGVNFRRLNGRIRVTVRGLIVMELAAQRCATFRPAAWCAAVRNAKAELVQSWVLPGTEDWLRKVDEYEQLLRCQR